MIDRYETIDPAELWFHDGLSTLVAPGSLIFEDVDMTATQNIIAQLRQQGIKCTYTHVVVRATALAIARHPELNRLILRKKLVYPGSIDISLSVHTGLSIAVPPELILNDAGRKDLVQISQEIIKLAADVREMKDQERLAKLRTAARFIRAGWMRRVLYRLMKSRMSMVRQRIGTFHVTCSAHVQKGAALKFATPAALTFTRVEERVVVRDGQPVVRPTLTISLAVDDRLWTGNTMSILVCEIKKILEDGELAAELPKSEVSLSVD